MVNISCEYGDLICHASMKFFVHASMVNIACEFWSQIHASMDYVIPCEFEILAHASFSDEINMRV